MVSDLPPSDPEAKLRPSEAQIATPNSRDSIVNLLRKVRDAGALDDNNGGEDWTHSDGEIDKANTALLKWANEEIVKELESLPKNKLRDHVNEAGNRQDISIVNYKFVEDRIAALSSRGQ